MNRIKDQLVAAIGAKARRRTGTLTGRLIRARAEDKELVLDEMVFNRWLAEACDECLENR